MAPPQLTLIVGNYNYSSWSMRPSVLMRQLGIPYVERKVRFDSFDRGSAFKAEVARYSPVAKVPVLLEGGQGDDPFCVWDTLAIAERLHELFPAAGVWPADGRLRARARSLAAEMHSGFQALRSACPMNVEASLPEAGAKIWADRPDVRADVERIGSMWNECVEEHGGPYLFGVAFCAADAFYAPVASRIKTYALPLAGERARAYAGAVLAAPGVAAWAAEALGERDFLDFEEPYRTRP